jgi:NhaA family Na+:H+ antiporter
MRHFSAMSSGQPRSHLFLKPKEISLPNALAIIREDIMNALKKSTGKIGKVVVEKAEEFFNLEASGGIVLIAASAVALIIANVGLGPYYDAVLNAPFAIIVGPLAIEKTVLLFVNDGLMAIFFLLVGLEIKREFLDGELSTPSQAMLPAIAAVAGMVVPAGIYAYISWDNPEALNGWAIPAATDIAFALGILALVGSRAPLSLKVLLTAIAIFDDLGAIIIIALFYTSDLSILSLVIAAISLVGLAILNKMNVRSTIPYVLIGIVLWVAVLKSGVHATLAGVALALFIPLRDGDEEEGHEPLREMEHSLHPWVAFGVLPVFGFCNAGVSFAGLGMDMLLHPVTMGVALGLVVGKQVGIFGSIVLAVKAGIAKLPEGADWRQIYGVSALCGIGFTMSLFIGGLAFSSPEYAAPVRLGVLGGSVISAICGYLILTVGRSPVPDKQAA